MGVFAMLGVMVIAALMVPVTMEFADEIHSQESNADSVRYSLAETDRKIELELIDGIGYINGQTIKQDYGYGMLMFSDDFIVMYGVNEEPTARIMLYSETGTSAIKSMTANLGTWTAVKTDDTTLTGTYSHVMAWNKNGNYGAMVAGSFGSPVYVNTTDTIYIAAAASATSMFVGSGTIGNVSVMMQVGDAPTNTITSESYTTEPNVTKITNFTSTITPATLFVPMKYDVITGTDTMVKTIVGLSPLFAGIALFAVMGINLVRMNKFN